MKNVQEDQIDELFRSELSSYTIPVATTFTTATIAAIAVKKGIFAKLSIIKLHVAYTVAIATSTVGGITYGTIKAYQHFTKPAKVEQTIQPQNQVHQPQGNEAFVIDTVQNNEQKTDQISIENSNNAKETNQTFAKPSLKPNAVIVEQSNKTAEPIPTTAIENNKLPPSQALVDTVTAPVKVVKKVVYIQKPNVVVQDTVIKVVKRKKK